MGVLPRFFRSVHLSRLSIYCGCFTEVHSLGPPVQAVHLLWVFYRGSFTRSTCPGCPSIVGVLPRFIHSVHLSRLSFYSGCFTEAHSLGPPVQAVHLLWVFYRGSFTRSTCPGCPSIVGVLPRFIHSVHLSRLSLYSGCFTEVHSLGPPVQAVPL